MEFLEQLGFLRFQLFTILDAPVTPLDLLVVAATGVVFFGLAMLANRWIVRRVLGYLEVEGEIGEAIQYLINTGSAVMGMLVAVQGIGINIFQIVSQFVAYPIFELNERPISVSTLLKFMVFVAIFLVISRLIRKLFLKQLFTYMRLDTGVTYTFMRIIHYLIMVVGVLVAFQAIGVSFSGLAVIFGFLSVGIGFGLQNITSNFVAGLILLFERPIKVGDRVIVGDTRGDVQEINIRGTTIRTERNISIIVPNSDFISSNVVNLSHGDLKVLVEVNVGVSYNSDLDAVLEALGEVADASAWVLKYPAPKVHFTGFGDSAWDMQLRVWVADPKTLRQVRSDLNCDIVRKFRERNIEIPFPQRDLHLRHAVAVPISNAN